MSKETKLKLRMTWWIVRGCAFIVALVITFPLAIVPEFGSMLWGIASRIFAESEELQREAAILDRNKAYKAGA